MTFDLNSFVTPGYNPEMEQQEISNPTVTPQGVTEARPTVPTYKVQPVVWLFVSLALAVVGLYFFLGD